MTPLSLPAGKKLVLSTFAESQEDAIENGIKLETMEPPDPAALKPTDVIVCVKSASVAFIDMLMLSGQYQHVPPLPFIPGMEYAGEVVWCGEGVDPARLVVGDSVMSDFMVVGPRSLGEYNQHGGWASYAVSSAQGLHRIPKGFSHDNACNLILNYETAYYALVMRANLQPGETVLISGASGAAGMAAVQVAKILGAKVIATGRSDSKLEQVRAFGADHVINTTPRNGEPGVPRFRDDVRALTGGLGVNVVYDTVGGDVSLEMMRSLDFGGRMVIVGWAANTKVAQGGGKRGSDNANTLPTNIMMMKGLYVMGSPMVIHGGRDPVMRAGRLEKIFQWVAEGRISPFVSHTYPLEQFRDAMRAKLSGEVNGGCVLHPWN